MLPVLGLCIKALADAQGEFYLSLPGFIHDGTGWMARRNADLMQLCRWLGRETLTRSR